MKRLALIALLAGLVGCASAPLTYTPEGQKNFKKLQVIHALDAIRDVAIDANAATPPLISTEGTRVIVKFHQSALVVIKANANGWGDTVLAALREAVKQLKPAEQTALAPYVLLASTLIQGLTS